MKQYKTKQFKDGEKYIESVPSGYPDWWREFEGIVKNSFSLETLRINLMDFEPFSIMPRHVNGQVVFNPLVYDFLENNQESLKDFRNGHIKGLKLFKKRYFKKYPKKKQAKTILKLYNSDFKETILRGDGFFNELNTAMLGFYNGILTGYWKYENDHLKDLLNTIDLKNEPQPITEKKKENNHQSIKTLEDHFHNITDFDSFINDIEKAFQNEKGKTFVGVVKILQENDVLVIQDRKVKPFLGCLKKSTNLKIPSDSYFSRILKELKGIENKKMIEPFENPIKTKLDPIIRKYKSGS